MNREPKEKALPLEESMLTPTGGVAPRCQRIKRNGEQCRNPARTAFRVCAKHGAGTHHREQAGERRRTGRPPTHGLYTAKGARQIADIVAELEGMKVDLDDSDGEMRVLRATLAYLLGQAPRHEAANATIDRTYVLLKEAAEAQVLTPAEGAALGGSMAEARRLLIANRSWATQIIDACRIIVSAAKCRAETNSKVAEKRAIESLLKLVHMLRHILWDVLDEDQLDVVEDRLRREVFGPLGIELPTRAEVEEGLEA